MVRWKMKRLVYALAITLAILAGMAILYPLARRHPLKAAAYTPGDPLGIDLVGMIPCGSDVLYDATGKKIGRYESELLERVPVRNTGGELRREFIFRIPQSPEQVLCLPPQLADSRNGEPCPNNFADSYGRQDFIERTQRPNLKWESGTTVTIPVRITPPDRSSPPSHVDVTFRYYMGKRNPADCVLNGPFTAGGVYSDPRSPQYKFRFTPGGSFRSNSRPPRPFSISLSVEADRVREAQCTLIIYDRNGKRIMPRSTGSAMSYQVSPLRGLINHLLRQVGLPTRGLPRPDAYSYKESYELREIELDEIAAITLNERPHERRFRNIPLSPHGGVEADHMAYLDDLAARLGEPPNPERMNEGAFIRGKGCAATIDMLRGHHLEKAAFMLTSSYRPAPIPQDFSPEELQRFHQASARALRSFSESTRRAGLAIGLWGGWPEFLDPALELIRRPQAPMDSMDSPQINNGLMLRMLEPRSDRPVKQAQTERIIACLRESGDRFSRDWLIRFILNMLPDPEREQAIMQMVESDNPWAWSTVFIRTFWDWKTRRMFERRLVADRLAHKVIVRAVTLGMPFGISESEELTTEANALLAGLLTPEMVEQISRPSGSVTTQVAQQIGKRLPPEEATRIFARFMREAPAREWRAMHTGCDEGYQETVEAIIGELVRLGKLPASDPRWSKEEMKKRNWPDIARDAIAVLNGKGRPGTPGGK